MTRKTVRFSALLAATLSAGLLASCASIADSGPVHVGLTDLKQSDRLVQVSASGPTVGASQEQLVRGFLLAALSSTDNYSVAREFLTRDYAQQWNPYSGVLINEGTRPFRSDTENTGTLSLSATATIDATGKLLPAEPGASTELQFTFVQEGGEWRISAAPTGIILDRTSFVAFWSDHRVHFLGPAGTLVPETRWFLSRPAIATEIVNAMMAGPSERLAPAVHSGFPPGTQLTGTTVPVIDGRARVDLIGDGLTAPETQQEILGQLRASLLGVNGVTQIELLIDGVPVKAASEPEVLNPVPSGGGRSAGIADDRFGVLSGQNLEPVTGITGPLETLSPSAISLSRSKAVAVVLAADGASIVADGVASTIDSRSKLIEPSVDASHWAWSYSGANPDTVRVTRAGGASQDIPAPWLAELDVHALRISPDGSLAAAFVQDGDRSLVMVSGIIRDATGMPTGFSSVADVEMWASGTPIDFDWVSSTRFVALTQVGNAGKVTVGGAGMFATDRGSIPDATHIAGGGSEAQIRVLNVDGDLFSPQGSGWQRTGSGFTVLAKRG